MTSSRTRSEADRQRHRRRAVRTLVGGVALGSTGHIAAVTVSTIVAQDLAGTSALSGAPGAAVVAGAALGATLLSRLMVRSGRRTGLAAGYAVGVVGAALATVAIVARSMPLLLLGTLLVGFGNASNQLSRYAAADMFPVHRRASALGTVVWAATIGAILGPNLVGPSGTVAEWFGLPRLAGPYIVPIFFVGLAAILSWVFLRPDPYELADRSTADGPGDADGTDGTNAVDADEAAVSVRDLLRRPTVATALVALVAGQVVMVLIMTMTPLHMTAHGHHLETVGLVISGHVFGMYALAPISGRLTDRFGSGPVIVAGLLVLSFASLLAAVAPPDGGALLFVALFLLGYGWNLGYVAGSALLSHGLELAERTRLQGTTDSIIWSSAAAASLGSGIVVAAASYTALGLMGAGVVIVPIWLYVTRRSRIIPAGL
jgi:MFS family permease